MSVGAIANGKGSLGELFSITISFVRRRRTDGRNLTPYSERVSTQTNILLWTLFITSFIFRSRKGYHFQFTITWWTDHRDINCCLLHSCRTLLRNEWYPMDSVFSAEKPSNFFLNSWNRQNCSSWDLIIVTFHLYPIHWYKLSAFHLIPKPSRINHIVVNHITLLMVIIPMLIFHLVIVRQPNFKMLFKD